MILSRELFSNVLAHGSEMVPRTLVVADRRPSRVSCPGRVLEDTEAEEQVGEAPSKAESAMVLAGGKEKDKERSPTRLKRSHHKVRTGCVTCRCDFDSFLLCSPNFPSAGCVSFNSLHPSSVFHL